MAHPPRHLVALLAAGGRRPKDLERPVAVGPVQGVDEVLVTSRGSLALRFILMAELGIVDLTISTESESAPIPKKAKAAVTGQASWSNVVGHVDTATVAAELEALRKDLTADIKEDEGGLQLAQLVVSLTVSAEGGLAFIAKGSVEASIEVTFSRNPAPRTKS